MMKKAFITGVNGQDGSYLAELLLSKGYEVHGLIRRSSSFNTQRVEQIYHDPHESGVRFLMHYGDLSDSGSLINLIRDLEPDEIYHLGAQSHVKVSFDIPEYTADATAMGTIRHARGDPRLRCPDPLLSGVVLGDVRIGASAAERADPVPSPQPLRRLQGVRLLVDRELPGGVRPVRLQRHPVQP